MKTRTKARVTFAGEDEFDLNHSYEIGEVITFVKIEEDIKGYNGEQYYVFVNDDDLEQILEDNEFEWMDVEKWDEEI